MSILEDKMKKDEPKDLNCPKGIRKLRTSVSTAPDGFSGSEAEPSGEPDIINADEKFLNDVEGAANQ